MRITPQMLARAGLLLLVLNTGCLRHLHPIHPPMEPAAASLPCGCRGQVYLFFVHGIDPLDYANLYGLRQHCYDLGYTNSWYGQLYHGHQFTEEIRRLHREQPEARFVLLGFSAGANVIRGMANELGQEDIPIDLMVYMGGNTLEDAPRNRPTNAMRVLHILATGYVWKGYQISGAENYKYLEAWHFDSPTHPETLRMLAEELRVVACRVPVMKPIQPTPEPELLGPPTPRPTKSDAAAKRDEWDFLKPSTALRPVPAPRPLATTSTNGTASTNQPADREKAPRAATTVGRQGR